MNSKTVIRLAEFRCTGYQFACRGRYSKFQLVSYVVFITGRWGALCAVVHVLHFDNSPTIRKTCTPLTVAVRQNTMGCLNPLVSRELCNLTRHRLKDVFRVECKVKRHAVFLLLVLLLFLINNT